MCGIVGVYNFSGMPVASKVLRSMTDVISHRGPDGEGHYIHGAVGLGHRRLAIIDLSAAGRQPMGNAAGDVIITYNGEIYNFQELRIELQTLGYRFLSKTDTEVLLYAYEAWGESFVERLNGMFAFAIYDRRATTDGQSGKLFIARDRFGVKPIYYFLNEETFLFGSEIKALLKHPAMSVRVCSEALSQYFTFQNVFSDHTLFEGVRLLPPGTTLTVTNYDEPKARLHRYWDYHFSSKECSLSPDETAEHLYHLFKRAVTRQLVGDVPIGAYLSGGMDSGSITAVASMYIPRLHTFSGGFDLSSASGQEMGFDERPVSEEMANRFKTEHYEVVMHAGDMEHVLPELIWHLEDLRVGQSYPNYYTARLASKFVKVVLSGCGGDELFGGYPWRYYRSFECKTAAEYYQSYYDYWQRLVSDENRPRFFNADTYPKIEQYHPRDVFQAVFANNVPEFCTPEDVVNASLYFETKTFLHGLFVVEDKLSMAHSLETRVPFLDNELVDFAMSIPASYKLRKLSHALIVSEGKPAKKTRHDLQPTADGKIILRDAMKQLLPDNIISRTKQGFSAPDASWFRGESIDYVNKLLLSSKARINEYLSPTYVRETLTEHTSGKMNHRLLIWSLLSFEWWLREFAA